MTNALLFLSIAFGGACGALLRNYTNQFFQQFSTPYLPWGTFSANVLGCFLIGVLSITLSMNTSIGVYLRGFLIVGVLGAFTTFSSFSLEVVQLAEINSVTRSFSYILFTLCSCLFAVIVGIKLARSL